MFLVDATRPTYTAIGQEARVTYGLVPKSCWIAHALEISDKKPRAAPNRIDCGVRKYPCPVEKQSAIMEALRRLAPLEAQRDKRCL